MPFGVAFAGQSDRTGANIKSLVIQGQRNRIWITAMNTVEFKQMGIHLWFGQVVDRHNFHVRATSFH